MKLYYLLQGLLVGPECWPKYQQKTQHVYFFLTGTLDFKKSSAHLQLARGEKCGHLGIILSHCGSFVGNKNHPVRVNLTTEHQMFRTFSE